MGSRSKLTFSRLILLLRTVALKVGLLIESGIYPLVMPGTKMISVAYVLVLLV